MITLYREIESREGGQGIWLALCLTVLLLAVVVSAHVFQIQKKIFGIRQQRDSPPQAAVWAPGRDKGEQACEDLLGQNRADWSAGQTAVPALFVVQPGTEVTSIWLGQQAPGVGSAGPSYSSVWQDVSLPVQVESLTLTWSWRLQTSEAPAAVPGAKADRQQALLLDKEGELLEVMHNARTQTTQVTDQRHNLSPYAGQTVRVYFNAYNDGSPQSTSLRLDHWALWHCQPLAATTDSGDPGNARGALPSEFSDWGPATRGFSLWILSILAFVALAGVGLVEKVHNKTESQR